MNEINMSENETLKVHILQCHIDEYLEMSGKTCWSSNDECVEAVHQLLERKNFRHWLKKTKKSDWQLQEEMFCHEHESLSSKKHEEKEKINLHYKTKIMNLYLCNQ